MADSGQDDSDAELLMLRVPACDACRSRKIKCDRKAPCSSCRSSAIACRTTKKRPEKRQRFLVSTRYEREVEDLNGRLISLENLLQTLANGANSVPARPTLHDSTHSTPRDSHLLERELEFEGESTFVAHSRSVVQAFDNGSASSQSPSSEVLAAVTTLRNLLHGNSAVAGPAAAGHEALKEVVDYKELAELSVPPSQVVLRLLRYIKAHPQRFFYDILTLDEQYITTLCQQVYFPTEEYSIATFITVHISLFYLFRDLPPSDARALNLSSSEVNDIVSICCKNAMTAISHVRLATEASYENIEALWFASMLAVETSRPYLKWTLISTAARMCQDAGYHRLLPCPGDVGVTKKRLLFWYIYAVDHGAALNLGRSPTLRDGDITADRPRIPEEIRGGWAPMFLRWLDFSQLQGEIYDTLYSAGAQRQQVNLKIAHAQHLAARLQEMESAFVFNINEHASAENLRTSEISTQIVLKSTLTLVYRAIPPPAGAFGRPQHPLKSCEEAVKTAREALVMHNEAWSMLQDGTNGEWRLFIHWTLLWSQFIPFIVIFGDVIAEKNRENLRLLEQVVNTLHSAVQRSPGLRKLCHASSILYRVASAYLDQHSLPNTSLTPQRPLSNATSPARAGQSTASTTLQIDPNFPGPMTVDLPVTQQDWDSMLDEWDLGLDAEGSREMSSFFEQYLLTSSGGGFEGDSPQLNSLSS